MEIGGFEILIGTLVFLFIFGIGGAVLLSRTVARTQPIRARLRDKRLESTAGGAEGERNTIQELFGLIGSLVSPKGPSEELKLTLSRAGFSSRNAPLVFLGVKILSFAAALFLSIYLVQYLPAYFTFGLKILLVLIGAMVGMVLPNSFIAARRIGRQKEVRSHLPDAVDLLEICVSAGMGIDMAWRAVMEQVRRVSVVMADEMSLTDMEINLGGPRASALRHMADRTGADELNWLVSAFVQSERFGTSLSETLKNFASAMREDRLRRAEESAEKMAVRILFPLVVFIFPTIIIVCAGPAGLKIIKALESG